MVTEEEKKLIEDALNMSGKAGVNSFVLIDGTLVTNYVPFRLYKWNWTEEHAGYVKDLCSKLTVG